MPSSSRYHCQKQFMRHFGKYIVENLTFEWLIISKAMITLCSRIKGSWFNVHVILNILIIYSSYGHNFLSYMTCCFFSVAWHLNEGVFWSTLRCWSIQHIYYLVSCFDKRDKALVLLAPEVYITNFVFDNRAIIDKLWYDLHVHKIKSYNRSKALIKQRIKLWRDVNNLATSSH